MKQPNKIWIVLLTGIIICMLYLSLKKKTIELFNNQNNNVVGGAIITLQNEFTKLLEDFDKLEECIEKIYPEDIKPIDPKPTIPPPPTIRLLYETIKNSKYGMYAVMETDILQPPPVPNSSIPNISSKTISNTNIKGDSRWPAFQYVLNELSNKFTELSIHTDKYLAIIPDPLSSDISYDILELIRILKNIQFILDTLIYYIKSI